MSYLFASHLLLRQPVKGPAAYTADSQRFLDVPFFRVALYLASPVFYHNIEHKGFLVNKLNDKEKNTLRKYINRYCYRPTPFGLFASVSLATWGKTTSEGTIDEGYRVVIRTNQACQQLIGQDLVNHELRTVATYEGNPSLYRVLNEYRFFRTGADEDVKHREYQLQSIAFSRLLKDLIVYCHGGRYWQEIVVYLVKAAGCSEEEAAEYADFLSDAQLLVNKLRPNITGPDYIARLLSRIDDKDDTRVRRIRSVWKQLQDEAMDHAAHLPVLNRQVRALLAEQPVKGDAETLSVVLHRPFGAETLSQLYQEQLRAGLYALDALSPPDQLPSMTAFIRAYQQHFEGQWLPLLAVLDPEIGIGYQQRTLEKNNPLLETLQIPYNVQPDNGFSWTAAHSYLLECWHRNDKNETPVIRLHQQELEKLKSPDLPFHTMGMSVLFRITGELLYIESAGGINAPALMGRFTIGDEGILLAAKQMSAQQEQQNPDVLFAELLHLADPHADNINRRESIWSYELPITAASALPAEQQLELSDLYVGIQNNQVLLYSKKHGKVVMPKLTSAYNHSLNKLPLFRFLADLPYQYGRHSLSLDLRQYFPGLSFYPRVEYRSVILSPATWIIGEEQLLVLQQPEPGLMINAFRELEKNIDLPWYFLLSEGDQQLVFNRESTADVLFFAGCVAHKKEVVIKEFLPQKEIRQYNAYLLPQQPANLPRPGSFKANAMSTPKRKYIPGSEWLYLKIYAPRAGAGRLLLKLKPLLKRKYTNGTISKWFFIRYEDHAPHIRLRMQLNPAAISEVLLAFKTKLEDRIQQHVIREYQIEVYSRELERYAAAGIEQTENFFCASSALVLSFLHQNSYNIAGTAYHFTLFTTKVIISTFIDDPDGQLLFTLSSYQQFLPEFAGRPVKKELDKKYRELSPAIRLTLKTNDVALLSGSVKAGLNFVSTLQEVHKHIRPEDENRIPYLRSIIHMHLNRIFTDEARKQEMIIYYLLYKYLLSEKGREKQKP